MEEAFDVSKNDLDGRGTRMGIDERARGRQFVKPGLLTENAAMARKDDSLPAEARSLS